MQGLHAMDAGKAKVVLNELREELQTRRGTSAQAGAADDAPVLPARRSGAADLNSGHSGGNGDHRREPYLDRSGVLVDLNSDSVAQSREPRLQRPLSPSQEDENVPAAELAQRPIPELVVPFFVPQEPFVVIAPYLVPAVLTATVVGILMLLLL
jgi:hypothetical protein